MPTTLSGDIVATTPVVSDTTNPVAGTLSITATGARYFVLSIGAGTDTSGEALTRIVTVYLTSDTADPPTPILSYPRYVGPKGSDITAYYADGLTPSTSYTVQVVWKDTAGNVAYAGFLGCVTIAEPTEDYDTRPTTANPNPLLVVDDRAEHRALPLELPEKPDAPTVVQTDAGDTDFQRTLYPAGALTGEESLDTGTTPEPWTVENVSDVPDIGGFRKAEWDNMPSGAWFGGSGTGIAMHIDSTGDLQEGDKVYFTETTPVDLTNTQTVSLELYSGGNENATGGFLNLIMAGEDKAWERFPLTVKEAGNLQMVEANISAWVERDAVVYWGIESASGEQFVIWWKSIRAGSGVYGERDYKVVVRREYLKTLPGDSTPTVLLQLDSIESDAAVTDPGSKGQINTLTFGALPASKAENAEYAGTSHDLDGVEIRYSRLIYGKDVDAGMVDYHYVGSASPAVGTAVRTGTTLTVTTSETHTIRAGQIIHVTGEDALWGIAGRDIVVTEVTHTGSVTRNEPAGEPTALARVITTTAHGLETGMHVSIEGTANWHSVSNKSVTVEDATTFTYICTNSGGPSATGLTIKTLVDETHFTYVVDDAGLLTAEVSIAPQNYADSALDISQGLTLKEARCQIPHAVNAVGTHHRTLVVQKDGNLWFSSVGDITWWSDTSIHEAEDVGLGEFDSCWVNLTEAGPVQAIVPLGVYTGADYQGDTLVLCKRQAIYLKGVGYKALDLGYRKDIGCVRPHSWCKVDDGTVAVVSPEGNIYTFSRQWETKEIGQPIAPELWKTVTGRGE
jgi:hypothetical protein